MSRQLSQQPHPSAVPNRLSIQELAYFCHQGNLLLALSCVSGTAKTVIQAKSFNSGQLPQTAYWRLKCANSSDYEQTCYKFMRLHRAVYFLRLAQRLSVSHEPSAVLFIPGCYEMSSLPTGALAAVSDQWHMLQGSEAPWKCHPVLCDCFLHLWEAQFVCCVLDFTAEAQQLTISHDRKDMHG